MESRSSASFAFLFLVVVVCDASLPSKVYWNTMLPDVPMPNVVQELLLPGGAKKVVNDGKQPFHDDVKKANNVFLYNTGKQPFHDDVKKADNVFLYNNGKQPFHDAVKKADNVFLYNTGKQPFHDAVKKADNVFLYNTGKQPYSISIRGDEVSDVASKHGVHDHDNLFLLEKDLSPGREINVDLIRNTTGVYFIPRQLAETIPFSMNKLTEILEFFSFKPESSDARTVEETLKACSTPSIEGEEKHSATSLESMVDFVVYKLGKNVQALSTEIGATSQQYTSVQKVGGSSSVVCHRQAYPYAVFLCHEIPSTKVYKLSNESNNAIVAICHTDTSKWNPEYVGFEILNVKPGDSVCHYLPEGHVVWTSEETSE